MHAPSLDPEYRRCPVAGRWVIIAPARGLRPLTLQHAEPHHRDRNGAAGCPLCEGAEEHTPREVYAVRDPGTAADGPGWRLRVVPNKFPAVHPIADPSFSLSGELFDSFPGFGEHDLIVECPRHESDPKRLTDAEFAAVLTAYQERMRALARNPVHAYSTVFKNVGAEAGASLAHLHSQIITTPIVPEWVRLELDGSRGYFDRKRRCVFCDMIREDRAARLVAETEHFVALCPYAPRFAYEVWVLPSAHASRFEDLTPALTADLGRMMKTVVRKLDAVLREPAFNTALHTAPLRSDPLPHFHWHFEVIPRTSRPAGFEWGSGCFLNAVPPERAAAELRAA